jgi:Tfp pilus assembly protein PilZ
MFLSTDHPLEIDTTFYMEFIVPATDHTIRCQARVAWVNQMDSPKKPRLPAGMGVQFLSLSQADKEAIHEYIKTGEQ